MLKVGVMSLIETADVRSSATVVLARPGPADPEVFMVRRHERSAFGSAYAFPGGVVDPGDGMLREHCGTLSGADANVRLGVSDNGLDYFCAAIRELFEETGVLLADSSGIDEDLTAVRSALNDGELNWPEFVRRCDLVMNCEQLNYISHWITPESQPKRYSTRFFLTELPDGQIAEHCGGELTDSRWSSASDMLAAERNGDVEMIFPTIKTLESVARHKTMDDLLDWAQTRVDWGITTMVPVMIERGGKRDIVLPGDRNYPGAKS